MSERIGEDGSPELRTSEAEVPEKLPERRQPPAASEQSDAAIRSLQTRLTDEIARAERAELQSQVHAQRVTELERALYDLRSTWSWKVTRPLRFLGRVVRAIAKRFFNHRFLGLASPVNHSPDRNLPVSASSGRGRIPRSGSLHERIGGARSSARTMRAASGVPLDLGVSENPSLSVVIPATTSDVPTLQDVPAVDKAIPFEVLIVGEAQLELELAARYAGQRFISAVPSRSAAFWLNEATKCARGTYVLFLQPGCRLPPNVFRTVLQPLQAGTGRGIVGGAVVAVDGTLISTGGQLTRAGVPSETGRGGDLRHPDFAHVQKIDFPALELFVVSRDLLTELGGFANAYRQLPACLIDLCLRARASGIASVFQPLAPVTIGQTAPHRSPTGQLLIDPEDRSTLAQRWGRPAADSASAQTSPRATRVLYVDAYVPRPDRDSGSYRIDNIFTIMLEAGCELTVVGSNLEHVEPYVTRLQQRGIRVLYWPYTRSIRAHLDERGDTYDVVILSRMEIAEKHIEAVRRYCPQARVIFDTIDLHHLREARRASLAELLVEEKGAPRRAAREARERASEVRRRELEMVRRADISFVVSEAERKLLEEELPHADVRVVSNVHRVFGRAENFEEREDILFIGSFAHPPNVDAVQFFVADVFPLIKRSIQRVKLYVVGSEPPEQIKALSRDDIVVTGYVHDVEPYFRRCKLSVAPLRYGSGVKGKINHSMSHGLPVVCTPVAAEGMELTNELDVLVADGAAEFAAAVCRLYTDANLWERLSRNGIENVRRHFSFAAARRSLAGALGFDG